MNFYIVIWLILFIVILIAWIYLSQDAFKKMMNADKEKKAWKIMDARSGYYRLLILSSLLLAAGITFLIKHLLEA